MATGATICYLISAYLGEVLVALPKWKARVDSWKVKMKEHDDDMLSYLVVLRMMPLPPHNIGEWIQNEFEKGRGRDRKGER